MILHLLHVSAQSGVEVETVALTQRVKKNPTGAVLVFKEGTSSQLWRLEVSQVSNVAQRPNCEGL